MYRTKRKATEGNRVIVLNRPDKIAITGGESEVQQAIIGEVFEVVNVGPMYVTLEVSRVKGLEHPYYWDLVHDAVAVVENV